MISYFETEWPLGYHGLVVESQSLATLPLQVFCFKAKLYLFGRAQLENGMLS